MANSFTHNNYIIVLNVLRLTFLAICCFFCFASISCTRSSNNDQLSISNKHETTENAVDINSANRQDLEKLPKIGKGTAERIITYRSRYGRFRRIEELILVKGMSDKKFREIQNLVKVE